MQNVEYRYIFFIQLFFLFHFCCFGCLLCKVQSTLIRVVSRRRFFAADDDDDCRRFQRKFNKMSMSFGLSFSFKSYFFHLLFFCNFNLLYLCSGRDTVLYANGRFNFISMYSNRLKTKTHTSIFSGFKYYFFLLFLAYFFVY